MSNQIRLADFPNIGGNIGNFVAKKNMAYGDAINIAPKIMELLFPDGILPGEMKKAEVISRIVEKMCRICRGVEDAYNENPWADIIGYALHGYQDFHNRKEMSKSDEETQAKTLRDS